MSELFSAPSTDRFRVIGGPTVWFTFSGHSFLSDPTFDGPTDYGLLRKTASPAVSQAALGTVEAVLLSHDDHVDNCDHAGREYALRAPLVITTPPGVERLRAHASGSTIALSAWDSFSIGDITITAVPALHGPADGVKDALGFVNCEVNGYVLQSATRTLYISGDNTALEHTRTVKNRFGTIDWAILHGGRASVPAKFNGEPLSMSSEEIARAARILGTRKVVVVHQTHWAHFTEGPADTIDAFTAAGLLDVLDDTPLGELGSWESNGE